jgi:hypothetical protein
MRPREDIHAEFVRRFHLGKAPVIVTDEQLDQIESELNTHLPFAYRQFITRHGVVHSQCVLSEICDKNLDHPDVQDFMTANEAIDDTKAYWSAGMPDDIIGFASDCMGNMIGFRRQNEPSDEAPVFFFDHDFVEVSLLANSFDQFLLWYLDNLEGNKIAGNF